MRLLLSLAALCTFFCQQSSAADRESHPHIVVIMVDDMGYGDPGCFNPNSQIATPHIDSLARDGMRFTDAHAPGPLCHMSRYGLMTGRYPFRTNVSVWPKQPLIEPDQMTIASLAKSQGYRTAMVGKWHLGFKEDGYDKPLPGGPVDCGFHSFYGIRASTDIPPYFYIRDDKAIQPPTSRIEANSSEGWSPIQGAFWRAGGIAPNLTLENVLPQFTNVAIEKIKVHAAAKADTRPMMMYLAYPAPHTPWLPSEEFVGKSKAGMYGDFLMMVDDQIGRVLSTLREVGWEEKTLLVFTSDNGPVWYDEDVERLGHDSSGGLRGMKADAWEAGHRMPFIVRWPGNVKSGTRSHQLVCFTDLLATFADVLDVRLPEAAGPDSFSFLPTLTGAMPKSTPVRTRCVMQPGNRSMKMIRSGDWKLITGLGSGGFSKPSRVKPGPNDPAGQLYNLAEDPGETNNLYLKHPGIVARLTAEMQTIVDEGRSRHTASTVDRSTLKGKVMVGYQGWFNCEGDGADLGWTHWARHRKKPFGPDNVSVDFWPDVSELDPDERFATDFKRADGSVAEVFSSRNRKTVLRHFRWMYDYGIDGAFVQRFANGLRHEDALSHKDAVLSHAREGAARYGRAFSVMYDLSGMKEGTLDVVREDWRKLQSDGDVVSSEAYLHHKGRPLVAIWGVGFKDRHEPGQYTLSECRELILALKESGCSIMLGVPTGWREGNRDAVDDAELLEVLKCADVLSPWTVGRYRSPNEAARHADQFWSPDIQWCSAEGLDYLPVVYPGFSWHNLKEGETALGQIPRLKGEFFWSQIVAAKEAGTEMIYVAMFDEVDEGTAIFKCTNEPPTGDGVRFLTYDGLPSDHYLRLAGQAGELLRGRNVTPGVGSPAAAKLSGPERSEDRADSSSPAAEEERHSTAVDRPRPNVMFIVCDDLNTHVSTSGYPHIRTPSFDHLAAAGMTFRRAYCQYPVCGPSRASFLHGLYPQSTGVLDNRSDIRDIRPGTVSMPQRFKESGYWTAAVGKVFHNPQADPGELVWHANERFENDEMPFVTPIREKFEAEHGSIDSGKARRQWRQFYPTIAKQTRGQKPGYGPSGLNDEQHKDGRNARQIARWLTGKAHGEGPFFMACGIQKPHVPFLAPDAYFEMYPLASLNFEPASLDFWNDVPKLAQTKRYEGFGFEFSVRNDQLRREYIQAYHACISFIDAQIGIVFDALRETGHWDDTIVVLTSDHGYMLGEKFMWGKVMLFEQCDRVPLVIRVPGRTKPGSSSDGLVELVDLFPTLTELCKIAPPKNLQGRSLVPMLRNPDTAGKDVAYTVVSRGENLGKAIRTDRWRYTRWPVGEELFDLQNDPSEKHNLASSATSSETITRMRQLLAMAETSAVSLQP